MKNKKLTIGLVSAFIGTLALAACSSEVTSKDNALVTYLDNNGKQVDIITDDIYDNYRHTSDGISKFYNAILETIIRHEFDTYTSGAIYKKTYADILKEAENNVKSDVEKAEQNSDTNNTSYQTEWENILASHNCEDKDELLQYYVYEIEKTEIQDKYFADNKTNLIKQYIGIDNEGNAVEGSDSKFSSAYPYHIRHVLIKVSDGASKYTATTLTSTEAKNLGTAISYLCDSKYSFAQVATKLSEDEGSAAKGGDLGIMTTTTSFVNEFKLGIYAYDILTHQTTPNDSIEEGLGVKNEITVLESGEWDTATVKEKLDSSFIVKAPYGAFSLIGEKNEIEKDSNGQQVNKGNTNYYPRNVLFNNYLNFHNPFLITNQTINDDGTLSLIDDADLDLARWSEKDADNLRYLVDENGNYIIGVRSEHGIHFMIMQKSIYDFREETSTENLPTLEEYYTTNVPGDDNFPSYTEGGVKKDKSTYVNYIRSDDVSSYNTRATEIKEAIKSFDKTYNYRLYEEIVGKLIAENRITFNTNTKGSDLGEQITSYIEKTRANNKNSDRKSLADSWKAYLEKVDVQNQEREYVIGTTGSEDIKRIVHVRCAMNFTTHSGSDWTEGGMCYYEE